MNKAIVIDGELDQKGTDAYELAVLAVKAGMKLKPYITKVLKDHVKKSKN